MGRIKEILELIKGKGSFIRDIMFILLIVRLIHVDNDTLMQIVYIVCGMSGMIIDSKHFDKGSADGH